MGQFTLTCQSNLGNSPTQTECGLTKTFSWEGTGSYDFYYYIQATNRKMISFTFTPISNNGSNISIDLIYERDGITITADTFNLGSFVSATEKYHYLNFGDTNQLDGNLTLKVTLLGGTTGSFSVNLDCNIIVGSAEFCYQNPSLAARNLCDTCVTPVRIYWERSNLSSDLTFSYNSWYLDSGLTIPANVGYYALVNQVEPKTIYYYDGASPSINYYCNPNAIPCGNSLTQSHTISEFTSDNPYIRGTKDIVTDAQKYSITETFIELPDTNPGVVELTLSHNATNVAEVFFTISDVNASEGEVGSLSYTTDIISETEFFTLMTPKTLFQPDSVTKTMNVRVAVNGNPNSKTKTLRIRASVGVAFAFKSNVFTCNTTVYSTCSTPYYSYTVGIHTYSPYDAITSPKVTTVLYSLNPISSWTTNTRVWNDSLLLTPALPYYYGYNDKVYKVGKPFSREFGTQTAFELKTSAIKKIAKWLGLTKKNPVTVTQLTLGPKNWATTTNSPACVTPIMDKIGFITEILNASTLPVPTKYLYYVGYDSTNKQLSNDSVFTEYNWSNNVHTPITGMQHALTKIVSAFVKGSANSKIKGLAGTPGYALGAVGLGVLAAFSGSINEFFIGQGIQILPISSALGTAIFSVLAVAALILTIVNLIVNLFKTLTKTVYEDCKNFTKVFTSGPYIETGNTIYSNSGFTSYNTGYFCDGGYFYTQSSSSVSVKEISYVTKDGVINYSSTPDNPVPLTFTPNIFLLPYISGVPIAYSSLGTIFYSIPKIASVTTPTGELTNALDVTYSVPTGFFTSSISQEDANNNAQDYLESIILQGESYNFSKEYKSGVTGVTMNFTHELKVENISNVWTMAFDNGNNQGLTVDKKIYYDIEGEYSGLNGYYSFPEGDNYLNFYQVTGGTVVNIYSMANSSSTQVTSQVTGQIVNLSQTNKDFTSSWYFTSSQIQNTQYDSANNLFGFNQTWNTSEFYSNPVVRRGFIKTPLTKSQFYLYNSNTNTNSYSIAPEQFYNEIPNVVSDQSFLWLTGNTLYFNFVQVCSDDVNNGILVQCVDSDGDIVPSLYGANFVINIFTGATIADTRTVSILGTESEKFVQLPLSYVGNITNVTISGFTSQNPINSVSFSAGTFNACNTPTPTPTPVVSPNVCYQYQNYESYPLDYIDYIDCNGVFYDNVTIGSNEIICARAGSLGGINAGFMINVGDCVSLTPTPTPTPTQTLPTSYPYLGRTTPDAGNSTNACTSYLTVRPYYVTKSSLVSIVVGDRFYNSYPSTPTNGGNNWVALKSSGVGTAYSFQIDTSGYVTQVGGSCTPDPTPTPGCNAPTLNSVTLVSGSLFTFNYDTPINCTALTLSRSRDQVNWNDSTAGCTTGRQMDTEDATGTWYFRITQICSVGGSVNSNIVSYSYISPTPTPTPTNSLDFWLGNEGGYETKEDACLYSSSSIGYYSNTPSIQIGVTRLFHDSSLTEPVFGNDKWFSIRRVNYSVFYGVFVDPFGYIQNADICPIL